ncbi:MAG: ATP-binding protein [Myxococcota bacterium]|nr:ATP-binding protein [Myxococcota bacterium]MDP7431309.1 ATP-binding protein [Myxococcota bacterium]
MSEGGPAVDLDLIGEVALGNVAVLVVDGDGRVVRCNASAAEIFGREQKTLVGCSATAWFPEAAGGGILARALTEGVRFQDSESWVTRPDGVRTPVAVSCAPIAAPDGRLRGAVASFQDLSGIRQLQQRVLQTEKMAAIGQLAAGVAHEINNPMGFIHANLFQMGEYVADLRRVSEAVDALRKSAELGNAREIVEAAGRLGSVSDEVDVDFLLSDLAKAIRESQEGSERIRHIVQDLRDFSHQDTGEQVRSDLNQCLDSTANIVWPMMKHVIVLEREYEDLPAVLCYPMQLKQVFMNLLVNAFQAIEEKLEVAPGTGRILLQTARRGDRVVVSVTDSGVGIDPANVDRIFAPFFTTKKVGTGTGLGLSTAYNIVHRHGGSLDVESAAGGGVTFRLTLPVDGMPRA